MRVRFATPIIDDGDRDAVAYSLNCRALTNAGNVRAFEQSFQDFCGGGMASATTSCMGALHLATLAMVDPGSEVIVPALTHPATALAVSLVGATPVFVDVDRKTGNVTPEIIKAALTPNTSAVMVLHYLGTPADMPSIMAVVRDRAVVIEDCALALGTFLNGMHVGLFGHAGCFSFYPAKHITTGEGGMLLTKHPNVAEDVIQRRHFGQRHERGLGVLAAVPDWVTLGLNYRMTEMQGALGVRQMAKLPDFLQLRQRNYNILSQELSDFEQLGGHYALSVFVGPERDRIAHEMKKKNVETSVYYKQTVPGTAYYGRGYGTAYRGDDGLFSNAEEISRETICFPVGPHITEKAIKYMVETFRSVL